MPLMLGVWVSPDRHRTCLDCWINGLFLNETQPLYMNGHVQIPSSRPGILRLGSIPCISPNLCALNQTEHRKYQVESLLLSCCDPVGG